MQIGRRNNVLFDSIWDSFIWSYRNC